jgi:CRISPR/Cas system CSM-associated protein Csm3 (group 7 of RAMP superfamily)
MTEAILTLKLLSATTFGRGDGVAGLIDCEVEHDSDGFPFLRGRALKGLLREAGEELVHSLADDRWQHVLVSLFGKEGSGPGGQGQLHVGDAQIPKDLRDMVIYARQRMDGKQYHREEVLAGLNGIRRQTAMNEYGAPRHGSLRSLRVVLRGTTFEARLTINRSTIEPSATLEDQLTLVACSALALRAAGTGRNRGRGRLQATLKDEAFTLEQARRLIND